MAPQEAAQGRGQPNKRKGAPASSADNGASRNKRQKTQRDARTLAVQTTSKAFKNGELDVGAFVKAREFEIRALEEGLARSKKALTQRAFQQVPKELRRRTASHNAKRVPKRLRKQAVREMDDDNTPTVTARRRKPTRHMRLRMETVKRLRALGAKRRTAGKDGTTKDTDKARQQGQALGAITTRVARVKKNMLSSAPLPPAKFRKRQVHKTWLPTHIYHAKRAHMTPPREPLWRFAIPLTSTAKSYRPTHRATIERGAIAWDMSYMSCISVEGYESSIQGVLKALGVGGPSDSTAPWGAKGQRWRNGSRVWQGWLYERDMYPSKPIAPATVIWRAEGKENAQASTTESDAPGVVPAKKHRRQALIRVHPSAFLQLWEQVTRLVKIQKPQAVAEDLRFELGSIEITGPGSTEALLGALWPATTESSQAEKDSARATWTALAGVTNPAVLPANALLSFDITDPRLHHPPRTIDAPSEEDQKDLLQLLADWPDDTVQKPPGLFSRNRRLAASRALSSQKAINHRKTLAQPGSYPEPLPQDPRIPVMLYPSPTGTIGKKRQATWVVMLPWKAVPAVWQSIMYYPLSTGGQVKLGGLQEKRQVTFESGSPWFPGDFPGTQAGKAWEDLETAKRRQAWERRPKGKRIEWDSLNLGSGQKGEVGDGCACDWTQLQDAPAESSTDPRAPPPQDGHHAGRDFYHLPPALARLAISEKLPLAESSNGLATVRVVLLTRGVATSCARIYRLPKRDGSDVDNDESSPDRQRGRSLRARWLSLDPAARGKPSTTTTARTNGRRFPSGVVRKGASQAAIQQILATDLLRAPARDDGDDDGTAVGGHPEVPGKDDLIGFVTTGEYCLTEGKGVAIGSVSLQRIMDGERDPDKRAQRLCIVRNAGETVGRLAEWNFVE